MNYAQLLLPDFSLIVCGYLICRYTALNRTVWDQVDKLVYYLLFPLLLFHSIVKSPLDWAHASTGLLAAVGVLLSGIALSYSLPYWPGAARFFSHRDHAGVAQVAFRFHSILGLAIIERVAGAEGLQLMALIIGVGVPIANVGAVWPMAKHAQTGVLRELARNPLIIGTVSGLLVAVLGIHLPAWVQTPMSRMGAATLALGLLAAGAGMQLSALAQAKVLSAGVLGIRHLALPLVAWGLCVLLHLPPTASQVVLIFASLPTASSCYALAARMGYDGGFVGALVTLSVLLGMASLPFGLALLS
ncbi:AEC family transporter [Curvibacter sp. CHRR-16]|nr:AEC family transporter [Curvibacter sp. CHRR-16]